MADDTQRQYENDLGFFVDWCDEEDIQYLSEVDGQDLMRYKQWRAQQIQPVTLRTNMKNLRVFLRWASRAEIAQPAIFERVPPVRVQNGRDVRNEMLDAERAEMINEYLSRYRFASRDHAMFLLTWRTGIRTGTVRAIDLKDVNLDSSEAYIEIRHRPPPTPLKNGKEAEREINLADEVADVVSEYVDRKRIDVQDDSGRQPLFSTKFGRIKKPSIRRTFYDLTRPCVYANDCPHGRDNRTDR